jgi:outer membrane protein OmpA-like peptidoglycan-associated protein
MSRRHRKAEDEETTYWLSYSDMMAALLLTFILIFAFTEMQAQKKYESQLHELEQQQQTVEEQQATLKEQEKTMKSQQQIMADQQEQLNRLVGVKEDLITELKNEFDDSDLTVSVDPQTGAITLDSSILFDFNKYELKASGKKFLNEFLPRYTGVLLSETNKQYIAEIIIEGHTDTKGDYLTNLELSQKRALSVATYCLDEKNKVLSKSKTRELRDIITANGRSYSDPILKKDGSVNMDASRRVEFKFRLKDEDMISEMMNILNQ